MEPQARLGRDELAARTEDHRSRVTKLAEELHFSRSINRNELNELTALGLILDGLEEGLPPILRER